LRELPTPELLKKFPGLFLPLWATVYFRELAVPLKEADPNLLGIIFNFANTFTEESVLHGFTKQRQEITSRPSADTMRKLGYSDEEIAGMDLYGAE
jgi:hypothetical protein